jgi:hypothetical protein
MKDTGGLKSSLVFFFIFFKHFARFIRYLIERGGKTESGEWNGIRRDA